MSLHGLFEAVHNRMHKHYTATREGVGTFQFCESRLPAPVGGVRVAFQPDDRDGDRAYGIPMVRYADGDTLFERMLYADSAHHAMALLRRGFGEGE
jgi:hypothetical protein